VAASCEGQFVEHFVVRDRFRASAPPVGEDLLPQSFVIEAQQCSHVPAAFLVRPSRTPHIDGREGVRGEVFDQRGARGRVT